MKAWQTPKFKPTLRIIIIIILELFLFFNLSPQSDFSIEGCFPKEQASARLSLLSGNYSSNPKEAPLNALVPPLKLGEQGKKESIIELKFNSALVLITQLARDKSGEINKLKREIEKGFKGQIEGMSFAWVKEKAGFVELDKEGLEFILTIDKGFGQKESRSYRLEDRDGMITITRIYSEPNKVELVRLDYGTVQVPSTQGVAATSAPPAAPAPPTVPAEAIQVTVTLSGELRELAGKTRVEARSKTLSEVIEDLDERYPGIKKEILDGQGKLKPDINIYINGERITDPARPINEGDEIRIIPAMAGGSGTISHPMELATANKPTYMAFCLLFGTGIDLRKINDSEYIGLLARSFGVSDDNIIAALKDFQLKGPDTIVNEVISMVRNSVSDPRSSEPEFFILNVLTPYLIFVSRGYRLVPRLENDIFYKFTQTFKTKDGNPLKELVEGFRHYLKGGSMHVSLIVNIHRALKPYNFRIEIDENHSITYRISDTFHIGTQEIDNVLILKRTGVSLLGIEMGQSTVTERDVTITEDNIQRTLKDVISIVDEGIIPWEFNQNAVRMWKEIVVNLTPETAKAIIKTLYKRDFEGLNMTQRRANITYNTAIHEIKHRWDEHVRGTSNLNVDLEMSAYLTAAIFGSKPYEGLFDLISNLQIFYLNIRDSRARDVITKVLGSAWQLAEEVYLDKIDEDTLRKKLREIYEDYRCIGNGKNLPPLNDFEQNVVGKLKDFQTFL